MKKEFLLQIIAGVLILIFVYAALSKIMVYPEFVIQLQMDPYLKPIAGFLAWGIPATEIVVTTCLFVPGIRIYGFIASLVLMIVFTLYIAGMLAFDSHLPCSCGGVLQHLTWIQHLIFNIFFCMLSLSGILLHKKYIGLEGNGK